ncbi:MAG: hypothetical protein IJO29_03540 [Oscillospiraceae bacterium]|nr:hypothetical protein [Oscillospiraceae bacterium]
MQSKEDMQKYIDEMMRLYSQNNKADITLPPQSNTPQNQQITPLPAPEPVPEPATNTKPELLPITPVELIEAIPENLPANESYTETGFLQVNVTAGEKAFPLENAVVVITQKSPLGQTAISINATDKSGRTPIITLPAPDIGENNDANTPFASYTAEIFLKGYHTVINENVPIFSGITSILPVNMVPLPTNATNRREITFYSNEPQF